MARPKNNSKGAEFSTRYKPGRGRKIGQSTLSPLPKPSYAPFAADVTNQLRPPDKPLRSRQNDVQDKITSTLDSCDFFKNFDVAMLCYRCRIITLKELVENCGQNRRLYDRLPPYLQAHVRRLQKQKKKNKRRKKK